MTTEHIRQQLQQIAEQLDDLAMSVLRDAVEEGATTRPEEERKLTRARRSVEKAISILGE